METTKPISTRTLVWSHIFNLLSPVNWYVAEMLERGIRQLFVSVMTLYLLNEVQVHLLYDS